MHSSDHEALLIFFHGNGCYTCLFLVSCHGRRWSVCTAVVVAEFFPSSVVYMQLLLAALLWGSEIRELPRKIKTPLWLYTLYNYIYICHRITDPNYITGPLDHAVMREQLLL